MLGATSNGADAIIYMTCGPGDSPTFRIYKVDSSTGNQLLAKSLDTADSALNVKSRFSSGGTLSWDPTNQKIVMVISRTMHSKHQGKRARAMSPPCLPCLPLEDAIPLHHPIASFRSIAHLLCSVLFEALPGVSWMRV